MKLIGRLGALVFGILGFFLGLIFDAIYAGANHIFEPGNQTHGFIVLILLVVGLVGAIAAIPGPRFAALLLLIAAVGFLIIAQLYAVVPAIFLLIAALLAYVDRSKAQTRAA